MKIVGKIPKPDEGLHEELVKNHWTPMAEPTNVLTATLLSIPFMVLNGLISLGAIYVFSTISLEEYGLTSDSFILTINIGMIFLLYLLVIVHEFLHFIFIPGFLKSSKTKLGLTWFGGFVITEEKLSKSRYILITVAPYFILSILLPLVLGFLGLLTPTLKVLILLNALASSVDMLNLVLISKQVPSIGRIISNGPRSYWKSDEV
ncbi:DUF3267 domain-containing protein [Bacillus timonensis]|nr:DUF3267 domain-containing protein [Bacillus timonensis]